MVAKHLSCYPSELCSVSSTMGFCSSALMLSYSLEDLDGNQLHTALSAAVTAEDYARAERISAALRRRSGAEADTSDWRALGCPDWLAARAERLGFRFPTGKLPGFSSLSEHSYRSEASDVSFAASMAMVSRCHRLRSLHHGDIQLQMSHH